MWLLQAAKINVTVCSRYYHRSVCKPICNEDKMNADSQTYKLRKLNNTTLLSALGTAIGRYADLFVTKAR